MSNWLVKYDGPCSRCGRVLLAGTPAVGTGAAYALVFRGGPGGAVTQAFTLLVTEPPTFTTTGTTATFVVGTAGSFTFTTAGYPPPAFTVSGALPRRANKPSATSVRAARRIRMGSPTCRTRGRGSTFFPGEEASSMGASRRARPASTALQESFNSASTDTKPAPSSS